MVIGLRVRNLKFKANSNCEEIRLFKMLGYVCSTSIESNCKWRKGRVWKDIRNRNYFSNFFDTQTDLQIKSYFKIKFICFVYVRIIFCINKLRKLQIIAYKKKIFNYEIINN